MKTSCYCVILVSCLLLVPDLFAAAKGTQVPWQYIGSDDEDICDPDFISQFSPFVLNDDLAPEVDDIVLGTYLLNLIPLGGLWGPLVLLDDDHPKMDSDIILSYLVPGCFVPIGAYTVGSLFSFLIIPLLLWPAGWVYQLYVGPTAALNAWDRAYKCGSAKSRKKKKKKRGGSKKKQPENDGGGQYGY